MNLLLPFAVTSWAPVVWGFWPPGAVAATAWPAWVIMWLLALAIYAALKLATLSGYSARHDWRRAGEYLLLWPGMNPSPFMQTRSAPSTPIAWTKWLPPVSRMTLGILLIYMAAPRAHGYSALAAGRCGMIGLLLLLHFGLFDVLSLAWRRAGIDALPLMNHPLRATSLSDFWGRRWNRAFRDVAHRFLFRPLMRPLGTAGATLATFYFSGVVHDIVISLPAGRGFGLPTLYFLLQGLGLLAQHSRVGARLSLRHGWRGRLFCAVVTIGPLGLLFHPPFVREIILPMLRALGALGGAS